ncbi:MAG: hypothetical protein JO352_01255 [Chloroflexi bacterium]|nr:hypothetical protein [Chloroflexota bacterium]MBV9597795.1 hypothetical protein [Chloroflexota bacterium]
MSVQVSEAAYSPISASESADEIMRVSQTPRQQTDGVGLRVGNLAEFTFIAPVTPGGAALFRERVVKGQIEAAYWEGKLGTVQDLRICLINNDTQILFAATYSDEFKPYVIDVIKFATPWIDYMFMGVGEGFPGLSSPDAVPYLQKYQVEANLWYAANPDATVRDAARAQKVSRIFNELLDTAQS